MANKRKHFKADAPQPGAYFNQTPAMEVYPGSVSDADPNIHAPKAPEVAKPENPDKGFLKEVDEDAHDNDLVLTQPLKYVVDPNDAIEKMESLSQKVIESRPELAPEVAVVQQAIENLEQRSRGGASGAPQAPEASAMPAFKEGDRVVVAMEEGTYTGVVEGMNEDGTFNVKTDQAMTLSNVPGTSMQIAEQTQMTLPASLSKMIQAARMVTDTIAQAFAEGKKRRVANTSTDGQTIWLHNNPIARKTGDGGIEISLAGWPTMTTRERLNGLMQALGINKRITQRAGNQMLDGKPWDGDWTNVGPPAAPQAPATPEAAPAQEPPMAASKVVGEGTLDVMPVATKLGLLLEAGKPRHIGSWRYGDKNDSALIYTTTPGGIPVNILVSIFEDGQTRTAPFQGGKPSGSDEHSTSEMDRFENLVGMNAMDSSDASVGQMAEDVHWYWEQIDKMSESWDEAVEAMLKVVRADMAVKKGGKVRRYPGRGPVGEVIEEIEPSAVPERGEYGKFKVRWDKGEEAEHPGTELVNVFENEPAVKVGDEVMYRGWAWNVNDVSGDRLELSMSGDPTVTEVAHQGEVKIMAESTSTIVVPRPGPEPEAQGKWWVVTRKWSDGNDAHFDADVVVQAKDDKEAIDKVAEHVRKDFRTPPDDEMGEGFDEVWYEWTHKTGEGEEDYWVESYTLTADETSYDSKEQALENTAPYHGAAMALEANMNIGTGEGRVNMVAGKNLGKKADKNFVAKLKAKKIEAAGASSPSAETFSGDQPKAKEGYKPTGIQIVEEGGIPRAFDPDKDDVQPAELNVNDAGKMALVSPDGTVSYEEQANDELELQYWKTVKSLAPATKPAAPAPAPEPTVETAKVEQKGADQQQPAMAASAVAPEVKASAFDEIPEIEIGGGFKARRKPGKEKKEGAEEEGAEIEVIDADGKVTKTFPDAFGDDTIMIIKFLRQVLDIKEGDDKKAGKKEAKAEGGESDIADKPKALPAAEGETEKPKEDEAKKELEAAAKRYTAKIDNIQGIAERLLRAGHIQANLDDVDNGLLAGQTLAEAQRVAAKKAVDRKVMDLLAQPEEELLIIKASLPLLEARKVTVQASGSGLTPINLSASGVIDVSGKEQSLSLGAAFGSGFRR